MANVRSTQLTLVNKALPEKIPASDDGKIYRKYFDYTVPAGNQAVNDTLELVNIQKDSRLQGGRIISEAMSSAGGTAGISVGDGTTAAKYLSAGNIDGAAEVEFGHTVALNFGELVAADFILTGTVTGEAWLAAQVLHGYVDYIKLG